jgi:hypothetical protein
VPPLPWLERYRRELERRGVPLSFQKRFMEELQDHLIDLTEEITMSENIPPDTLSRTITDRLGAPEHVATATAAEYARGRFAARHPFVMFGVMPLPVTLFLVVMLGIPFMLLFDIFGIPGEVIPRSVLVALAYTMMWLCRIVPFATAAALFSRAYAQSKVSEWWFVAAAAQVLAFAGLFDCRVFLSDLPGESALRIGVYGKWPPSFENLAMHGIQVAVAVAIGMVMIRTAGQRRSSVVN